jgi:HEPN domain-containing protein
MNRADLQRLSRLRIQEARSLLKSGLPSGAYYLAGYSVECAIKACIAKQTQRYEFPDKDRVQKSFVHKPADLLRVANLYDELQRSIAANARLEASWNIVLGWSEQSRYSTWSRADAHAMIDAAGRRREGMLTWLQERW